MSGLYPSLEDMQVDAMARAQVDAAATAQAVAHDQAVSAAQGGGGGYPMLPTTAAGGLYAGLGLEELLNYGGLDVSEAALAQYVPPEVASAMRAPAPGTAVVAVRPAAAAGAVAVPAPGRGALPGSQALVSITPRGDLGMQRAEIKQGVREVVLAKDQKGKFGVAVRDIDKGLFVAFVWQQSAAALGGLRFGDQILQINGENVAGWKDSKALKVLKKADGQRLVLAVRDRPWCRCLTVVKDSTNHIGFVFRHSEITAIVKDSSAARNGLLIHHNLIEVNGQNVVGLKDEQLHRILQEAPRSITLTIMPAFVYKHLIKNIGFKRIRAYMEHGVPEY